MDTQLTILGCGSSGGVPRIGNLWGQCDPNDPKNRRRRCSILLERGEEQQKTRVLIDTSPDLREQLLGADINQLDAVLYTHEHADHIHGIDELRVVAINNRAKVHVWANDRTGTMIMGRFGYCFHTPPGSDYPPILHMHRLQAGTPVTISGSGGDITALPFDLEHGNITALGFRFGDVAYSPDVKMIPEAAISALQNLETWIVDALRVDEHPSHFNLDEALDWINRLQPKHAILTNLHIDFDYQTLRNQLPSHIEPAYDGMQLHLNLA